MEQLWDLSPPTLFSEDSLPMASIFIPKLLTVNFIPPVQDYAPSVFPVDPITYPTFLCALLTAHQTQDDQN